MEGWGEWGEKVQGIRNIIDRHKRDWGRLRVVQEMEKPKNLYVWPMAIKVGGWQREGEYNAEGNKREGKNWDNCNSIINKIYLKKKRNIGHFSLSKVMGFSNIDPWEVSLCTVRAHSMGVQDDRDTTKATANHRTGKTIKRQWPLRSALQWEGVPGKRKAVVPKRKTGQE